MDMNILRNRIMRTVMALLLLLSMLVLSQNASILVGSMETNSKKNQKKVVYIDAGHGGT